MEIYHEEFKKFRPDSAALIEAGFVAIRQVDQESARKCFMASMVIDPNNSLPVLGLGIIHLFDLNIIEAKKTFHEILKHEPENHVAKTMLGIANLYTVTEEGLKEGGDLIEDSMSATNDAELKKLNHHSQELLKEIRSKMKDLHPLESTDQPIQKRLKK